MSQPNYLAWNIDSQDFPADGSAQQQLSFLLGYGILAPSSHNSQPWRFKVSGSQIIVNLDQGYNLPIADPDKKLAYIALGAAMAAIQIAGDYFGWEFAVEYLNENPDNIVARLAGNKVPKKDLIEPASHPAMYISQRVSNRGPYLTKPIPAEFMEWVQNQTTVRVRADAVSSLPDRQRLARAVTGWRCRLFDDHGFRAEIARYKRHNLTRSFTGMPGFTMGFPLLKSFISPLAIRLVNVVRSLRAHDEAMLRDYTPLIVLFSSSGSSPAHWLDIGQLLMQTLVRAAQLELSTSISALPGAQDSEGRQLHQLTAPSFIPQLMCRVGYAATPAPEHSPRLPVSAVCV